MTKSTTSTRLWKNIASSPIFVRCTKDQNSQCTTISGLCLQSSPKLCPVSGLSQSSRQTVPHTHAVLRQRSFCCRQRYAIRYDTIRDVILTCAWKPTWVSLIYCMETTAKKCKNRKTKNSTVKDGMCSEVTVNSLGNPCSESWRRKGKAAVGRICRKGRFWVWNERVSWWWNTDNNKYYCWQIMTV